MLTRWWDAFPVARANVPRLSVHEVRALLESEPSQMAVIDVRDDNELAVRSAFS
jgi:hypothetical protein